MSVPFWVMANLGGKVQLTKPLRIHENELFAKGAKARLQSIQAGERGPYATVIFDDDSTSAEENVEISRLRPA